MSDGKKPRAYLQLVDTLPSAERVAPEISSDGRWQRTLFAASNESLLCFIDLPVTVESDFLRVILDGKPRYVIDLRLVPTFDVGSLTRKLVFDLFSQVGSKYLDACGLLGIRDRNDARLNPGLLVPKIATLLGIEQIDGPLVVLVEGSLSSEDYVAAFAAHAQPLRPSGWEVLVLPLPGAVQVSKTLRNIIFVSHANPEDNEFARWLVTQLSLLGYEVWSDITKLHGGSYFWTSIEDAIRNHAAKVIVAISTKAQEKPGVLDEINCALSVERRERIEEFVIPVKIDDLPYDQVLANLARKNIIDFSKGWLMGLDAIVKTLDKARVPKTTRSEVSISALWSSTKSTREVLSISERLVSNWLRVVDLPDTFCLPSGGAVFAKEKFAQPMLVGVELADATPKNMELNKALQGGLSSSDFREVANATSSLLRQSWDSHALSVGLKAFELANKRVAWFVPAQLLAGDVASFKAMDGKRRKKILVGRSEKRNVYWHYGVEMRPVVGKSVRFSLLSHIIFTSDGSDTVLSPERMHVLRRGFCKSWWNDRWRDLELAFLSWLSPSGRLRLGCGEGFHFTLDCRPVPFISPVSLKPSASDSYDSLIADVEWDELDTGEDDLDRDEDIVDET